MPDTPFISDFRALLAKHNISAPAFAHGSKAFDSAKPKVLYSGPMYDVEELVAATSALVEGKWFVSGEHVQRFERLFSKYLGLADSVMVNSGSSADLIAIAAAKAHYGWSDGDGVIVSPAGFPTSISAITLNNLRPVFVDIEWETLNADNALIETALHLHNIVTCRDHDMAERPRPIRALFVSPVLGNPPDMDRLVALGERYSVKIVMDGCDSLGSFWRGKHLAQYAVLSTCSLFPSHHVSTGHGGVISSNDKDLIALTYSMATWGKNCWCSGASNMLPNGCCGKRFSNWLPSEPDLIVDHRYVFTTDKAYNLRPLDLQGAMGCVQMGKIEGIHAARRTAYSRIVKEVLRLEGVKTARCLEHADPSWFGVPIICPTYEYKRKLIDHLEKAGVQTREYFSGNILAQPGYQHLGNADDYPNAQRVLRQVFFIGNAPFLTEEHFDHIQSTLESFVPPTL